jgi:hypothetical protein
MPPRRILETTPIKLIVPALGLATVAVVALATSEPARPIAQVEHECIEYANPTPVEPVTPPQHVQRFAKPPPIPTPGQPTNMIVTA